MKTIPTSEEIRLIRDKWLPILEGTLLSACKTAILLEPQERWISRKDGKTFSSYEDREEYDNNKEISEEEKKQLLKKWDCVFNPLSTNNKKAMLIEPFTIWKQEFMCEFVDNKDI